MKKSSVKVNDYILDFLVSQGIKHVFILTGGAIAFVIDAFHGRKDISYVCVQHEQAGAMMAEAYTRVGPGFSAAMVTSGPGATNLITGICCAWFDSIPALYISGQVNTNELKGSNSVRQVGFQETEIVDIVKPITKYAKQITNAEEIRYELEKATYIAKSGRPGPVLLDIPMNFQRVEVEKSKLYGFVPPKQKEYTDTGAKLTQKVKKVVQLLQKAQRPVIIAGGGIKLSHGQEQIRSLVKKTRIPVTATWSGYDIFDRKNPNYIGAHGVYGERGANFTVQNSDVLVSVGSRLDTRQTGGKPETFARGAKIVMVDIDKGELDKRRGLTPYISIQTDAREFIDELARQLASVSLPDTSDWLKICQNWAKKYPVVKKEFYQEKKFVNAYVFIKTLSEMLDSKAIIIPDDGGHLTWTMQAFEIKKGQQLFSAYGNSPMGYAFPAAIGASIALNKKPIICIDGDGSLQINIQELQTVAFHKLPIKLFVFNNQGYGIIKQFQDLYLDGHHEATGKGVSIPDYMKVAKAYNIKGIRIHNHSEMKGKISQALKHKGPVLIEVMIKPTQKLEPKLEFGRPIEDISPLLPRKEFKENMIVQPLEEPKSVSAKKVNEIN